MGDGILIFQGTEKIRLIFIFIFYPFVTIFFLILVYKVLKRKRNRLSITLSMVFIIENAGLILNFVYLLIEINKAEIILYLLYFSSSIFVLFAPIFIFIFINILLRVDFSNKKYFIIVFSYAIGCILIHLIPGGITFSENWTPIYSLTFFIVALVFITLAIVVPMILYSMRLYHNFIDRDLKRRVKMFLVGITEMISLLYGVILFNTWQDPIFKNIYSILVIFLLVSSGLLIYYGIAKTM